MGKTIKNLVWGFLGQFLILATSIILPRFILVSFGSEINGVVSTITQIFTYIALLEAGIGNASLNRLYKNLAENDKDGISQTVSATHRYFCQMLPIYGVCVIAFAIIFPFVIDTEISKSTIIGIILIQGTSGALNFYFTNTYTQLLIADGRNYISSNLNLMVKLLSTISQIVLITCGLDIVAVQLSFLGAYIIKAIIINVYVKRKYPWLIQQRNANTKILEQRNSFLIHEVSGVVFQSTSVVLISLFCSLEEASVYSIYNMVFVGLSSIFNILFKGVDFKLGTLFHEDRDKYVKLHDVYETFYSFFVFSLISTAIVVILPFIKLYTEGINDANYIDVFLPILFSIIQILSCGRAVTSKLISVSGRAKNTVPNCLAEMVINIVASVIFVNLLGMQGALLGTIVALLYRSNDMIIYANKRILNRRPIQAYKTLILNLAVFAITAIITMIYPIQISNYFDFVIKGLFVLVATSVIYFAINVSLNKIFRETIIEVFKKIKTYKFVKIGEK